MEGGKGVTESDVIGHEQLATQKPYPITVQFVSKAQTQF